MRKIFFLISLIFIIISCNQTGETDFIVLKYSGLNGQPKKIIDRLYESNILLDDTIKGELISTNIFVFNEKGFVINTEFSSKYDTDNVTQYTVDESGINTNIKYYSKQKLVKTSDIIEKNRNKIVYLDTYLKEEKESDTLLIYVDPNNKYKQIYKSLNGTQEITFSATGLLLKYLMIDKEGSPISNIKYNINKQSLETEFISAYPNQSPDTVKFHYRKFDKHDNWIERIHIDKQRIEIETREIIYN